MAQLALRWILMLDAVTVAIPGARTPEQARANAAAADLAPLPDATMARIRELYERTPSRSCTSAGDPAWDLGEGHELRCRSR